MLSTSKEWHMKRYLIFTLSSILVFTIQLSSCSKSKEDDALCTSFSIGTVTKVEGPKTATVNQTIALNVYFTCFNGCGNFGNYEQTVSGNTSTIKVMAKYQGCICTQDIPARQSLYNFSAAQAGTYYLKFLQANDLYLIDTITVQ
jgi:hypothetical protein